jgi:hypothetical protein
MSIVGVMADSDNKQIRAFHRRKNKSSQKFRSFAVFVRSKRLPLRGSDGNFFAQLHGLVAHNFSTTFHKKLARWDVSVQKSGSTIGTFGCATIMQDLGYFRIPSSRAGKPFQEID